MQVVWSVGYVLGCIFLPTARAHADATLQWSRELLGGQNDPAAVLVDDTDNVYLVGSFTGPIAIAGETADPIDGAPGVTTYVAKFDSGGEFLWWNALPLHANDAALTPAQDVVVTGTFQGAQDMDPGPGEAVVEAAHGVDSVVVELGGDGAFVQAFTIGGDHDQSATAICTDDSGHVYVTGSFAGMTDFDPTPAVTAVSPAGATDSFVAKYDADGGLVWVRTFAGANAAASAAPAGIAVDRDGAVVSCGQFSGSYDFDPGESVHIESAAHNGPGGRDGYIAKLDAGGAFVFCASIGGDGDDEARAVAIDGASNILVAGYFSATADLDPGPGVDEYTSLGPTDGYVVKLDAGGQRIWGRALAGPGVTEANGLCVDGQGSLHVTGVFDETVNLVLPGIDAAASIVLEEVYGEPVELDAEPEVYTLVADGSGQSTPNAFMLKLNAYGRPLFVTTYETLTKNEGRKVCADAGGVSIAAGTVQGGSPSAPGACDTYLVKLAYPADPVWVDFGSAAPVQTGSVSAPFKRLHPAVPQVVQNGAVRIKGDSAITATAETLVIDKPMILEAVNGPVTIGVAP